MYIGFSSADLDQNQITDYLTRVVQPKLSADQRRAARRHPRRSHVRHAHLAEAGRDGGAAAFLPPTVHDALAKNNYLSALGSTKGSMVSVNLVANTDLRTPEEFRQMVVKEDNGVVVRLGEIADVVLGAAELRSGRPLQRRNRDLHGHLGAAHGQLAGGHQASSRSDSRHPGAIARRA